MGPQEHAFRSGVDVIVGTPGPAARSFPARRTRSWRARAISCSTKPTACSTWDSCPTSAGSCATCRRSARRCSSARRCRRRSRQLAREMLHDPGDDQPGTPVGAGRRHHAGALSGAAAAQGGAAARRCCSAARSATRWCSRGPSIAPTGWRSISRSTGINVERIHGNRSQAQRTEALAGFKSGRYRVLVATDIAARGIDVTALGHVINFDVPGAARGLHSSRRAHGPRRADRRRVHARRAGRRGHRARYRTAIEKRLPRVTLPDFDYQQQAPPRAATPHRHPSGPPRGRSGPSRGAPPRGGRRY